MRFFFNINRASGRGVVGDCVCCCLISYLCMQFFDVGALPKTNIAPENG